MRLPATIAALAVCALTQAEVILDQQPLPDGEGGAFSITSQQLADSFNVTAIYENYGFSARLAYNWRDKFLSAVNRGGGRSPVFFEPFGTLDAHIRCHAAVIAEARRTGAKGDCSPLTGRPV